MSIDYDDDINLLISLQILLLHLLLHFILTNILTLSSYTCYILTNILTTSSYRSGLSSAQIYSKMNMKSLKAHSSLPQN